MKKVDYRKIKLRGASFIVGSDGSVDGVRNFGRASNGYMSTSRMVNGRSVTFQIHRIVAAAFLEAPIDPSWVVDHIDGNKLNNAADNLRWCSHYDNIHNPNNRNATRIVIVSTLTGQSHVFQGYDKAVKFLNCSPNSLYRCDITGKPFRGEWLINIKRKHNET